LREFRIDVGWKAAEIPDHRHCRLLRARRERPRNRRAAEHCDEIAPLHWITSSAMAIRFGRMLSPSAFAIFRLITSFDMLACVPLC
jgi:hypothetical protein